MLKEINRLVLDEPTNHLNIDAKQALEKDLRAFKGTIIPVSHEPVFNRDWVTAIRNLEDWTIKIS